MAYVLSEEQKLLKDSAKDLLKAAPVSLVREMRDNGHERAFSQELWRSMIEMGWPALGISEDHEGLGFGVRGWGIVVEEMGRNLSNSPLISNAVASLILEKYGDQEQKQMIPKFSSEGEVVAIAFQEGLHFRPNRPDTKAEKSGDGWIISGSKDFVADAHAAGHLIINATSDEGMIFLIVDSTAKGVVIEKEMFMDSRFYSHISFDDVKVSERSQIGTKQKSQDILSSIINVSNTLIAAELIGLMSEAFERTIAYLKERRQFDRFIGSFQALQHRAADMYSEIEVAKSLVIKALDAIDSNDFMSPALSSMAKAKSVKTAQTVTNEGIQMYGGIGMTDDEEIGFFMKRARVAAQQYGSYSYHLDRFSTLSGY